MMFRPRESFDQHVLGFSLAITPRPVDLRYLHDVFGNCIGIARFDTKARELVFESIVRLEHSPERSLDHPLHLVRAMQRLSLCLSISPICPTSTVRCCEGIQILMVSLTNWSQTFLQNLPKVDALHVLTAMTNAIHDGLKYVCSAAGKPQSPLETLRLGTGTCRDFAVLMMEGCARSVSGAGLFLATYMLPATPDSTTMLGGGHTHAWVRVFLPNGGWAEFDPTNGLVGNRNLIRVAVVRDPLQATPLWGTWDGSAKDYLGMDVTVEVSTE